jgi:hypothetical protein
MFKKVLIVSAVSLVAVSHAATPESKLAADLMSNSGTDTSISAETDYDSSTRATFEDYLETESPPIDDSASTAAEVASGSEETDEEIATDERTIIEQEAEPAIQTDTDEGAAPPAADSAADDDETILETTETAALLSEEVTDEGDDKSGMSAWLIASIVAGSGAVLGLVTFGAYKYRQNHNKKANYYVRRTMA